MHRVNSYSHSGKDAKGGRKAESGKKISPSPGLRPTSPSGRGIRGKALRAFLDTGFRRYDSDEILDAMSGGCLPSPSQIYLAEWERD